MKAKFLGMILAVLGLLLVSCEKDAETKVEGVKLDKTELSLFVGATEKLTATVTPDNAANKKVNWTTSNAEIATVDAEGNVTGVKEGNAVITVTTEDGGKTASCNVTVSAQVVNVESVTLDKTDMSVEMGTSAKLTATVTPDNATNKNVTWTSSAESIATVDAEGNVTGVKEGNAVITVTTEDGGKTASCNVTVTPELVHPKSVKLDKTELEIYVGGSEKLTATITPEDVDNNSVTWSSSATDIATVGADGTVTGVKEGTAVITVTTVDGGKTATCNVTVTPAPAVIITGETFFGEGLAFGGEMVKLTADKEVTWSSSDETIAKVDAEGNVSFFNDQDGVSVTITATATDGSGEGTKTFTVNQTYFEFMDLRYDDGDTMQIYTKMRNIYMKCKPGDSTKDRISCKLYDIEVEDPEVVNAFSDETMGRMIGVTGLQVGETTKLTVTFKDTGLSLYVNLEVVEQ